MESAGFGLAHDVEIKLEATRGEELRDQEFEALRKRWRLEEGFVDEEPPKTPALKKIRRSGATYFS